MRAESLGDSRLNVAADGKRFRCDFIREGPVFYPEIQKGIECLRRETIAANLQSFVGKPLTIEHIDPRLNVADPVIFAKYAVGVVDKVGRDADSGWFFCEGEITSDAGRTAAGSLSPSCGFRVNETGVGGRWNNVPYERELIDIEFHHLALTSKRPRYEEAEFRLNSVLNPTGEITMFKLIKKLFPNGKDAAATTSEVDIPADATVMIKGKEVRLNSVMVAWEETEARKEEAEAAAKKKKDGESDTDAGDGKGAAGGDDGAAGDTRVNAIGADASVVIKGKTVKVSDLTAAYEARENAAADEQKKKDESRENATAGRSDFNKLNAAAAGRDLQKDFPQTSGSMQEKMKRGVY